MIYTLQELTDLHKKGEINEQGLYIYYPTEQHKENDSRWYAPGLEIKLLLDWKEERRKERLAVLWGNTL